jgi:hypothetical protein
LNCAARRSGDGNAALLTMKSIQNCKRCGSIPLPPNASIKPTRVAEQTAWQAVPAMLFVERHEFGLNALLGPAPELGKRIPGVAQVRPQEEPVEYECTAKRGNHDPCPKPRE